MASGLKELARIRFTGNRSVDHALEVSALRAVIQFEVLLNEIAWFVRQRTSDAAPTSKFSPRHRRIAIYMRNIEPGSTVVPLEVNADVMEWTEVRESLQLMSQVFSSPTRRSPIPEIPSSLALQFRKLANSLGPTETMEVIAAPNTSFPITRGLGRQIKGYGPGNRKTFEVREIAKVATGRESERIEAILQSLAAGVPKQEWERLPSDLSDELDHYLYGTPKK